MAFVMRDRVLEPQCSLPPCSCTGSPVVSGVHGFPPVALLMPPDLILGPLSAHPHTRHVMSPSFPFLLFSVKPHFPSLQGIAWEALPTPPAWQSLQDKVAASAPKCQADLASVLVSLSEWFRTNCLTSLSLTCPTYKMGTISPA